MRATRLALVVLLATGGLVWAVAGPAVACSCISTRVGANVEAADVIVTGRLVEVQLPPERPVMSSTDPTTYSVEVHRTFKGEPVRTLEFTSAVSGASCGLEGMRVGDRYAFFLMSQGDGLTANLCGGTAPARDGLETRIIRSTGPPVTAAEATPVATPPPAKPDRESLTEQTTAQAPVLALAGCFALVAGAAAWWRRRGLSNP